MSTAICREVRTTHIHNALVGIRDACHMAVGGGGVSLTSTLHRIFNSEKSKGLFLHCVSDSAWNRRHTYIDEVFAQLGCGTTSLDDWWSRFQNSVAVWSSRVVCHELSLAFFADKFGSTKLAKLKSRENVGVRYVLSPVCSRIHKHCPTTPDTSRWQFYFLQYIPHTRLLHSVITVLIELFFYSLISKLHPLLNHANAHLYIKQTSKFILPSVSYSHTNYVLKSSLHNTTPSATASSNPPHLTESNPPKFRTVISLWALTHGYPVVHHLPSNFLKTLLLFRNKLSRNFSYFMYADKSKLDFHSFRN
jgi:hypothetical protein